MPTASTLISSIDSDSTSTVTTEQTRAAVGGEPSAPKRSSGWGVWGVVILLAVFAGIIAYNARQTLDPRVANPAVTGSPRPVEPLWGDHWIPIFEIGTIIAMVAIVAVFVAAWRRHPRHPVLLMAIVTTLIVWQDPIWNWVTYAVYDPRLAHFPESRPLVSLSPTIEPLVVVGYVMFFLLPYFPGVWILRRIQARRPVDSFVWRHPLISLAVLLFVISFIFDAVSEQFWVRTQLYIFSQVPPIGSVFAGKPYQFPLFWESSLVTLPMIAAGVLLYRDDTGRTAAEKLARRARIFVSRPALGTFIVMLVIVNASYMTYGLAQAAIRATGFSSVVACPWPFPEAKVYDPQGFYAENSQPGPYSAGIWSTWMSGQPDGRPHVQLGAKSDRCAAQP
jgi:hypothetical protein